VKACQEAEEAKKVEEKCKAKESERTWESKEKCKAEEAERRKPIRLGRPRKTGPKRRELRRLMWHRRPAQRV
jgi:hypothetical protein